ncbi:endo-1,3-beta glucanase [Fusarium solani]|nr:endo-1,3-beta glucanase [Fusarium solani]
MDPLPMRQTSTSEEQASFSLVEVTVLFSKTKSHGLTIPNVEKTSAGSWDEFHEEFKRAETDEFEYLTTYAKEDIIPTSETVTVSTSRAPTGTVLLLPSLSGVEPHTEGFVITTVSSPLETEPPLLTGSIPSPTSLLQSVKTTTGNPEETGLVKMATSNDIFADPIDTSIPLAMFQRQRDHPCPRRGIAKRGPLSTNKFYSNIFLGDQKGRVYTFPYSLAWSAGGGPAASWGMAISHIDASQRVYGPVQSNGAAEYYINPVGIQSIIISAKELGTNTALTMDSLSPHYARAILRKDSSSAPAITFPIAQGSVFTTAYFSGATPFIQSGVYFKSMTRVAKDPKTNVRKFNFVLEDGTTWRLYAYKTKGDPLDLKVVNKGLASSSKPFYGLIQIAKDPKSSKSEAVLDNGCGIYPTGMTISGSAVGTKGAYTFTWSKSGHFTGNLWMFALPHHVSSFDSKTRTGSRDYKLQTTTKGLGTAKSGGFRYTFTSDCWAIGADLRRIREHLSKIHGVDLSAKPGPWRAGAIEEVGGSAYWRNGVLYQQLFAKGPRSELFEIARGQSLATLEAERSRAETDIQQATQAFQAKAKEVRKKAVEAIEEQGDLAAPNSWLRRLGAAIHLKDFSDKKQFLRDLLSLKHTLKPDEPEAEDDTELQHIHAAVRRLVRKAAAATRPNVVSWNVLFEVNRKALHKERSTPFHFRFKRQTRKKYVAVCLQFFAYVVRAMFYEDAADRPPFKLTRRQAAAFNTMMEHAAELADMPNGSGEVSTLSRIKELHTMLEEAALAFYISVLDHFTKSTEYDSALISFLMVLSIRNDNAWESYANFTPKLSAIMAISRAFLVKYTVEKRARYVQQRVEKGQTREGAEEKSPGHFEIMSEMARRFLVGGAEGWDTTPTQFIIRLRNYGMAADGNRAMPGSVSWDNENPIYKDIRINVLGVQSMLHTALRRAETLLYKHLLFCGEYDDQSPVELGLPEIPWSKLIDNAADATIGHSFVSTLSQLLPNSNGWAFRRVWSDETLRKAWLDEGVDTEFKLREKKAWQYGEFLEEFLQVLLFLVHLSGGHAARGLGAAYPTASEYCQRRNTGHLLRPRTQTCVL